MKKGKFTDYPSMVVAQSLGAKTQEELDEVKRFKVTSFETVKEIKKGNFPDTETFETAKSEGYQKHNLWKLINRSSLS